MAALLTGSLAANAAQRICISPDYCIEENSFIDRDEAVLYSPFTHETLLCQTSVIQALTSLSATSKPICSAFAQLVKPQDSLEIANRLIRMKIVQLEPCRSVDE